MMLNQISKRETQTDSKRPRQPNKHERHFEVLYLQSFSEMRARTRKN